MGHYRSLAAVLAMLTGAVNGASVVDRPTITVASGTGGLGVGTFGIVGRMRAQRTTTGSVIP